MIATREDGGAGLFSEHSVRIADVLAGSSVAMAAAVNWADLDHMASIFAATLAGLAALAATVYHITATVMKIRNRHRHDD